MGMQERLLYVLVKRLNKFWKTVTNLSNFVALRSKHFIKKIAKNFYSIKKYNELIFKLYLNMPDMEFIKEAQTLSVQKMSSLW